MTDMPQANLFSALRAAFPADLTKIAVEAIEPDGSSLYYTWADLEQGSARMANLLASLDLPEGSRIAVQVEKSVEAMMLYLATLRSGHVFLPLNTAYQSAEMEYFITNAEPAVVVCAPGCFGWVSKIAFNHGVGHVYTLGTDRTGSLLERAAHHSDEHQVVPRRADDLAAILYTSGTTGRSKGAMLSHGNLLSNAAMLKVYWGWQEGDVLIHALPIFHVHGLFVAIHGALLNGSPMIWFARFEPEAVMARFKDATVFMGVPTLYVRMLADARLDRDMAAHMRLFISGSAPMLIETFRAWKTRTGHTILERYGMSETIMLTSNPYQADARYGNEAERRGAPWAFRCRAWACAFMAMTAKPCPQARSAISRCRAQCLQGLLAHAREDGRGVHGRRLVQDRRCGHAGRARLFQHRGAQQGLDHLGRLQRLSGRGGGLHQRSARRGRKRPGGRAAPGLWRGRRCRHRAAQGRAAGWAEDSGVAQGQAGQFQGAQALLCGGQPAAQHHGQGQKKLLRDQYQQEFS
jgi:hypothetical protein